MRTSRFRTPLLVSLASMSLAAAGCGSGGTGSGDAGPIRIAVAVPYSGAAGAYGEITDQAFALALKKYGASIGDRPIELVKADTQCTPSVAAQAINRALVQKPVAVYAACAGDTLAMKSLLAARQVPMVTATLTPSVMADHPEYIWDAQPQLGSVTGALAAYMGGHGSSKVGVINDTTAYGAAVGAGIVDSLQSRGLSVAAQATYDPAATDYSGQILRIKRAGVDSIFVEGYSESVAKLISQARSLGVTVPIYASPDVYDNTAFKAGGAALNGVVFASPYVANDSTASKDFQSTWEQDDHAVPTFTEDVLYEGVAVLVKALHAAGPNPTAASLGMALKSLEMTLPSGDMAFGAGNYRDAAPIYLGKIQDGKVTLLSTVK